MTATGTDMTAALQALLDPTALSLGLPTPAINKEEYLAICLAALAGTRAKALVGVGRRAAGADLQAVVPEVASGGAHGAAVDSWPPSATSSAALSPSPPPPARAALPTPTRAPSSPASSPRTPSPVVPGAGAAPLHWSQSCKAEPTTQPPPTTKAACSESREEREEEEERRRKERLACLSGLLRCGVYASRAKAGKMSNGEIDDHEQQQEASVF
uniref:Uncharacterized protein n=1 Tax=Oryza nivara TaxID=4536 RepID=A0A0E0FX76_ORYNI